MHLFAFFCNSSRIQVTENPCHFLLKILDELKEYKDPELLVKIVEAHDNSSLTSDESTMIIDALGRNPETIDQFNTEFTPEAAIETIREVIGAADALGMDEKDKQRLADKTASISHQSTEMFMAAVGRVLRSHGLTAEEKVAIVNAEDPKHTASIIKAEHDLRGMSHHLHALCEHAEQENVRAIEQASRDNIPLDEIGDKPNHPEVDMTASEIESYLMNPAGIDEAAESRLALLIREPETARVIEQVVIPVIREALFIDHTLSPEFAKELLDLRMELPLTITPEEYQLLYSEKTVQSLHDMAKEYLTVKAANEPYIENEVIVTPERNLMEDRIGSILTQLGIDTETLRSETLDQTVQDWCNEQGIKDNTPERNERNERDEEDRQYEEH